MSELKPCPFCGSDAAEPVFIGNDNTRRRKVTIRCKAPGCTQGVTVGALRFSREWCHAEAVEKWNSRTVDDELAAAKARIAELESHVSELQSRRENMHYDMLMWRGITPDFDKVCRSCSGSGIKVYGSTSTWRGGIGGQMMTSDVCDKCWGSGKEDKPWLSHRRAAALLKDNKP